MAQQALPIADSLFQIPNIWTPTPIYSTINAASPNDGSFVQPVAGSAGSVVASTWSFDCQLTALTDPGVNTAHTFQFRFAYSNIGVGTPIDNIFISLYQGDPDNGGIYITDSLGGAGTTVPLSGLSGTAAFTTYSYTLTAGEAAAISNYANLWLQFNVQSAGSGIDPLPFPTALFKVCWLELEVPSAMSWWTPSGTSSIGTSTTLAASGGPLYGLYRSSSGTPTDLSFDFSFFWDGVFYPAGTTFTWSATSDPGDKGWWFSLDQFGGAADLAVNSRPKNPRGFTEITAFAAGSAGVFGGFPVATFENKLIYAPGGYSVGTDQPTLRIFDGVSDHEIATIPKTSAAAIPKGVVSILSANGTIYLSTLDSGTTAADFAGRVFELDVESGNLIPIGSAFTTGQVPYALAWHNGRLWVGSNTGDPTSFGKVYFFRPDVDTSWTTDTTLGDGGVCSLISYKGLLYVGCSGSNGTFAKVLVRGTATTYSTSNTGAGGTAKANNAFLSLQEFGGNLYASFWNPDTSKISRIWKFDNSTWTSVYSEATDSIAKPWVAFPNDSDTLLAIAGGVGYAASLISTTNGTSWTDESTFLTQSSSAATGLPAWGVVVR